MIKISTNLQNDQNTSKTVKPSKKQKYYEIIKMTNIPSKPPKLRNTPKTANMTIILLKKNGLAKSLLSGIKLTNLKVYNENSLNNIVKIV